MKIVNQLFLLTTAIFALSCSDYQEEIVDPEITYCYLPQEIVSNQTLYINFAGFHLVEGTMEITMQASNYLISETTTDETDIFKPFVYKYQPKDGYIGADYVEITRIASYMGESDTEVYRIDITVISD
ncbi:MAG: hypothetical protein QM500_01290 [Methylococcales bacterium]